MNGADLSDNTMGGHCFFHLACCLVGGGAHANGIEAIGVLKCLRHLCGEECFSYPGVTPDSNGVNIGGCHISFDLIKDGLLIVGQGD